LKALAAGAIASVALAVWVHWPREAEVPRFYTDAQWAHMQLRCGSHKTAGTGLADLSDREPGMKRGWMASMIPGYHAVRVVGGGAVQFGPQRSRKQEAEELRESTSGVVIYKAGMAQLITLFGVTKDSVLEWKPPGAKQWEKIDTAFLYPVKDDMAQKMVDNAIKHDFAIPGTYVPASEMLNPSRLSKPEEHVINLLKKRSDEAFAKLREKEQPE
jgi:hypothetical protein